MARDRARSSFTVEVRRGRTAGVETDPKRSLWRGHDLAGEAARHDAIAVPAAVAPASRATPGSELFAPRPLAPRREASQARVLPSLLPEATTLVEEPALQPERPEAIPRVRRSRQPRAAAVIEQPAPIQAPVAASVSEPEPIEVQPAAEPLQRRRSPRGERVLRAGERWKRRLPRSLW